MRMSGRIEKSTIPAKGDLGLSEFGIGQSYSEVESNDKVGMSRGTAKEVVLAAPVANGGQAYLYEPKGTFIPNMQREFPRS